jgi:predicted dithiol-disulfide oxidoreductase (DUF899 family)
MHIIGTREQWLEARLELLEQEKELTRRSDELARRRQALPWVPVETEYVFNDGQRTLADLFDGHEQLLVYHLMFGADWEAACVGCTFTADSFDTAVAHLPHHGVSFVAVSNAPVHKLEAYKRKLGWSFPWVSCGGTTFNDDHANIGGLGFNFGSEGGKDVDPYGELHGISAFALEDGVVYHTYSAFDRGTDGLNAVWQLLDRTPLGRQELTDWPRRRDEYH